jgi:hypothetical protein
MLRLTSAHGAWKAFAESGLGGWTLFNTNGNRCIFVDQDSIGLPDVPDVELNPFNNPSYQDSTRLRAVPSAQYQRLLQELPTLTPGHFLTSIVSARCDQPVTANDRFYLTARLFALPTSATPGDREYERVITVDFRSDAIRVE